MTLPEKIIYCRRKSGLSQEALAERLGVSRQAVSKWETGDATPEIGKLKALADAFGVTADWLLSEDEPEPPAEPSPTPEQKQERNWVDSLPGFIGTMIRRYGWLYGVYTALSGLGFVVIGALARVLTRQMFSGFGGFDMGFGMGFGGADVIWTDEAGNVIAPPPGAESLFPSQSSFTSPMMTFGGVVLAIGVVLIVAGVALAVYLKSRDKGD